MNRGCRRPILPGIASIALALVFSGCNQTSSVAAVPIGAVRVGDMNGPFAGQMPFEILPEQQRDGAQAGDSICTTYPGLFLDFRYSVVVPASEVGMACGRFTGWDRQVVTSKGSIDLRKFTAEFTKEMRKNLEFFKFND